MLPKSKRLNLKKDFKWVASGSKRYTPSLGLFFREGENTHPLVGISLKKGFFKKAHDRNRARRLASRAVEELYDNLRTRINLVIMPKPEVLYKEVTQIKEELEGVKDIYQSN